MTVELMQLVTEDERRFLFGEGIAVSSGLLECAGWRYDDLLRVHELPDHLEGAVTKRRHEYLAGRVAARKALRGAGSESTVVERGARGEPLWPEGYVGSISHGGMAVIAAVASQRTLSGIGVDVESRDGLRRADLVAPRILRPEERERFASRLGEGQDQRSLTDFVLLVFSLKESLYKAVYPAVQRVLPFHAASIESIEEETGAAGVRLGLARMWLDGFEEPIRGRFVWLPERIVSTVALPS